MKRLIIAILSGMLFGVVCYYIAKSGSADIPAAIRYIIKLKRNKYKWTKKQRTY